MEAYPKSVGLDPYQLSDAVGGRALVAGVLNVTPDSFSDGGQWSDPEPALAHGRLLHAQGADIIDVGGESTRPGSRRLGPDEEISRVRDVIAELAAEGVVVSSDTLNSTTAEACLAAGASILNDVSGGRVDARMPHVAAEHEVPYVLSHWRGDPEVMNTLAAYDDVVTDVRDELARQVEVVLRAGVRPDRLIVDPALGFAKLGQHDWLLLAHLENIRAMGFPVLVGASRKRFIGTLLRDATGQPAAPPARDRATAAISALAAAAGVWCVRVHEVPGSLDAVRVAAAWNAAAASRGSAQGPGEDQR